MTTDNPLLQAALEYAKYGLRIHPLHHTDGNGRCSCGKVDCDSAGKHPRTRHGFKDATTDPNQIKEWWEKWPSANIGIATGEVSNLFVIDVDNKAGKNGFESIKEAGLPMGDTPIVATPNYGQHYWYQYLKGGEFSCSLSGVDIKGDGGYVVAPPSQINGRAYTFVKEGGCPPIPSEWVRFLNKTHHRDVQGLIEVDSGLTDQQVLDRASNRKFDKLWRGECHDYGGDRSKAIHTLIGFLANTTPSDAQVRRLFRKSGLAGDPQKPERDGDRYINYSLQKFRTEQAELAKVDINLPSPVNGEWSMPTPLEHPDLPELEPDMLPGWARDFAVALSKATETPLELSASMVLAACSIATARVMKVNVESGYQEPTNLWLIAASPSGSRKSAVQTRCTAPLTRWERSEAKRLGPKIVRAESLHQTAVARAKAFRRKAATAKTREDSDKFAEEALAAELSAAVVPHLPRLWTSDTTPEKMGMLLADHGECMGWLSSEGGFFDAQKGRYTEIPNLDLILKAHAGDAERVDRTTRQSVLLENPLLTIGLSPQPSVLYQLATVPGFRGRGLLARFLYLMPPSNLGYRALKPVPIPEAVEVAYHNGLTSMLSTWGQPYPKFTIQLSDEAYSYLRTYRREVETQMRDGGELCHLRDWAGKAPGAAVRLAGVLHGIIHAHSRPWEVPISGETMVQAIRLMIVFKRHTLAAFGLMAASPVLTGAKRVLGWFERHYLKLQEQGKVVTRSAIWTDVKDNRTFRTPRDLEDAFGMLIEHGYIYPFDPKTGQPVERLTHVCFVMNPNVVEGWKNATNEV